MRLHPVDYEDDGGPVGAGHRHLVAGLQVTQPFEHRRARFGVDVGDDDRRAGRARRRAAGVPAGPGEVCGDLERAVMVETERVDRGRGGDGGDLDPHRGVLLSRCRLRHDVGGR
jgi:hypothetical protein